MKKKTLIIIVSVFVLSIIALMIYNGINNFCEFSRANAINCISALAVVGISFFIVQRQTDYRKQKEVFIRLLESIINLVDDEKSYRFANVEKEEMLMRLREISTKIGILKKLSDRFGIQDEANYLSEKLKEYKDVIDNHSTDMAMLRKMHLELKRPLNLISQKIYEIMIDLYS